MTRVRLLRILVAAGALVGLGIAWDLTRPAVSPDVVAALARYAAPVRTAEPGADAADLAPLRAWVGGARVVALGEATHGTREFFQLKHRIVQTLVEELGFTDFAIEASLADTVVVDRYVKGGPGTAEEVVGALRSWPWHTEEVLALVRWMRAYNDDRRHPRKVGFHGIDVQHAAAPAKLVVAFLDRVDPALAATARARLEPIDTELDRRLDEVAPPGRRAATRRGVRALVRGFAEGRARYVAAAGEEEVALAERALRTLAQGLDASTPAFRESWNARDRAMAENVLALLRRIGPGGKLVLWAHNGHVQRRTNSDCQPPWAPALRALLRPGEPPAVYEPMGAHLGRALGDDLRALAFSFEAGAFGALNDVPGPAGTWRVFHVPPAPPGTLDATFGLLGHPLAFVDLRAAGRDPAAARWLAGVRRLRMVGALYRDGGPSPFQRFEDLPRHFDGVLFVARTTAARPLDRRSPPPLRTVHPAPVNLGFEAGAEPTGWEVGSTGRQLPYRAGVTEAAPREGRRCAEVVRLPALFPGGIGTLEQHFAAAPYRGRRLRLRAWARAEVPGGVGDEAHLLLTAARGSTGEPEDLLARATTADRPIVAAAWQEVELEVQVPPAAETITIEFALAGRGRAFLDDVRIEPR